MGSFGHKKSLPLISEEGVFIWYFFTVSPYLSSLSVLSLKVVILNHKRLIMSKKDRAARAKRKINNLLRVCNSLFDILKFPEARDLRDDHCG